jgi:hypothetical protein
MSTLARTLRLLLFVAVLDYSRVLRMDLDTCSSCIMQNTVRTRSRVHLEWKVESQVHNDHSTCSLSVAPPVTTTRGLRVGASVLMKRASGSTTAFARLWAPDVNINAYMNTHMHQHIQRNT